MQEVLCPCTVLEPQNLSHQWERWKRAFDLYITEKESWTTHGKEFYLYIFTVGMVMQVIYFTLADEDTSRFKATVEVQDHYFAAKTNVPFERHLFRQIALESGETLDQFVCWFHQWAIINSNNSNHSNYINHRSSAEKGRV